MKWWLLVFVLTPDGATQFDVEYDSLIDCNVSLIITGALERAKKAPRTIELLCREWPLENRDVRRQHEEEVTT